MKSKQILLVAVLGLLTSALTAHTAQVQAVLKRFILTILALWTLAISVQAEGVPQQIANLQAQITALKATVTTLQTTIATLSSQLVTVRNNPVLAVGPFVTVDLNPENGVVGPNIVFKGANIHITSGSGNTSKNGTSTGLGNLIIGYDESPSDLATGERSGCHNLVIGPFNTFDVRATGGLVAGQSNSITGDGTSILGGVENFAMDGGTIVGGGQNRVFGLYATIAGGYRNDSSDICSTVAGGDNNISADFATVVVGGSGNFTEVDDSVILGGTNVFNPMNPNGLGTGVIGVVSPPVGYRTPTPAPVTSATLN